MFSLSRGKHRPVYGALIDIGSGTVGVGIVVSNPGDATPTLIYTHRILMRVTEHKATADIDIRKVREALVSATLILSQEGYQALQAHDPNARITELFVTCASPWAYTMVRNVRYENDEPFKITQAIIDDLVETAESEIIDHVRKNITLGASEFEIIERTTVDVTVNDYHVSDPIHVQGSVVSLSHVAGVIPKEIVTSIQEIQDKIFPDTELHLHTSILGMYCVIRDIFPKMQNYAIIDVTGEATECAIVENSILIENTHMSQGSNSFVRNIIQKTNRPVPDIQTHLRAYGDQETESVEFTEEIESYKKDIVGVVNRIREQRLFPPEIIVTAHHPYTTFFARIITDAVTQALETKPSVHTVAALLTDANQKENEEDVYLALIARFFHKVHRCGEPDEA